jgi:hypothetical protein
MRSDSSTIPSSYRAWKLYSQKVCASAVGNLDRFPVEFDNRAEGLLLRAEAR